MYGERLREVANYLSEGNTYAEAAEHFKSYCYSESLIKRSINENLPHEDLKLYMMLKSKRYMILQRVLNKGCKFNEARKVFLISWKRLDKLMREFYEYSPKHNAPMYSKYLHERHKALD